MNRLFLQSHAFPGPLLKESSLDQHGLGRALLVRSAWNSCSVGVEPLIRLVHARADPRHDQRLAPRVTELVVAARRQNDGTILPSINDCFTVSAGIELRVALQ